MSVRATWAGSALLAGLFTLASANTWLAYSRRAEIARVTTRVGDPAPSFSLTMLDGTTRTLESGFGQPQVLAFWATWCGPCKVELPELDRLATRLGPKARFLAISVDDHDTTGAVRDFLATHHLKLPVAFADDLVQARYRVSMIPHLVIVDAKGRVSRVFAGVHRASEIEAAITSVSAP